MVRVLDILFSFVALLFLIPLLIPTIIVLRLTGEREVFYFQSRVGLNGNKFNLIKFATMLKISPQIGTGNVTIMNDPRVLPFGKFLRRTKINELPQLINVLRGDMSIIGPRPLTKDMFAICDKPAKQIISSVKPCLSGIGSIYFKDEDHLLSKANNAKEIYKNSIAPYKSKLELWYVKNKSVGLYLSLIFLTIAILLKLTKKDFVVKVLGAPKPPSRLLKLKDKQNSR